MPNPLFILERVMLHTRQMTLNQLDAATVANKLMRAYNDAWEPCYFTALFATPFTSTRVFWEDER